MVALTLSELTLLNVFNGYIPLLPVMLFVYVLLFAITNVWVFQKMVYLQCLPQLLEGTPSVKGTEMGLG